MNLDILSFSEGSEKKSILDHETVQVLLQYKSFDLMKSGK